MSRLSEAITTALTYKQCRRLFWAIEINSLLWLMALAEYLPKEKLSHAPAHIWVGLFTGAVLQHWGYYNLYKPARKAKKAAATARSSAQ